MRNDKMKTNANIYGATILPKATTPNPSPVNRLRDWWHSHFGTKKDRLNTAMTVFDSIDNAIVSFAKAMKFNLVLALIAMLVVKFCPNIADKCPVLFEFFEGILIFYEFLFRAAFSGLKALFQLFTLNIPAAGDTLSAVFAEAGRLLTELFQWIQTITF